MLAGKKNKKFVLVRVSFVAATKHELHYHPASQMGRCRGSTVVIRGRWRHVLLSSSWSIFDS